MYPKTLDTEVYWKFCQDYGEQSLPAFVATIPNGRFWKNTAVISPDNKLLSDVSICGKVDPKNPSKHPVFRRPIPPIQKLDGTVAVLSAMGANTYFHWMIDVLPRIDLLRRSGIPLNQIDYFIVNGVHLPFQQETLDIFGIPKEKAIDGTNEYPHIKADMLVVPSFPRHRTCNIGKWAFDFLREEILSTAIPTKSEQTERIYINRSKANRRKVTNEAEVIDFLSKRGFKNIALESISVTEQARLLSAAECVIAPHGAGLTNVMFCNVGTKVIEIFSPNYVSISYWNISNQVGLDYYYLFGEGERPSKYTDPHGLSDDILVNLDSLSKILNLANLR
jgi:capsular polysaccharide biosynthesis protein